MMNTWLTVIVVAAAISVEVVVYRFWRASDGGDWWQRAALFVVGALAITALLYAGVI